MESVELIVAGLMASGLIGWVGSIQRRISLMGQCEAKGRERLARLEAKSDSIFDRLDRIDIKLDKIINGRHG